MPSGFARTLNLLLAITLVLLGALAFQATQNLQAECSLALYDLGSGLGRAAIFCLGAFPYVLTSLLPLGILIFFLSQRPGKAGRLPALGLTLTVANLVLVAFLCLQGVAYADTIAKVSHGVAKIRTTQRAGNVQGHPDALH